VIRRLLVAATAATGLTVLLPAAPAQALYQCLGGHWCAHYWYADQARTDLIGGYTDNTDCGGGTYSWGVRQGYLEFLTGPC